MPAGDRAVVEELLGRFGGVGWIEQQGQAPAAQASPAGDAQDGLHPLGQQDGFFGAAGDATELEAAGRAASVVTEQPGDGSGTAELQAGRGDAALTAGHEEVVEGAQAIAGDLEAQGRRDHVLRPEAGAGLGDAGGCREKPLDLFDLLVEIGGLGLGAAPDDLDVTGGGTAQEMKAAAGDKYGGQAASLVRRHSGFSRFTSPTVRHVMRHGRHPDHVDRQRLSQAARG